MSETSEGQSSSVDGGPLVTAAMPSTVRRRHDTEFRDIQNAVKEQIFTFLDPMELQIVRTVCRNWYHVINGKFGIKTVIDNRNTELVDTPWIVSVEFVSLTRPLPTNGIRFGNRLRDLHFKGIVVSYNLFPLLQSAPHLRSLTFDDPTVDLPQEVMRSLTPPDLSLPSCTSVELLCWNFTESLNTVLAVLCSVRFGRLRSILLRSVHPPMLPLGMLFVPSPRPLDPNLSPLMTFIMLNLKSLEELSVGTLIAANRLKFVAGSGELESAVLQLEELEIVNLFVSWTAILENQNNLKVLGIGHFQAQQWGEVRSCLSRCEESLVRIDLQGRSFGVPWECDIFENCRQLVTLHLNLSLSPKRHLEKLPVNLTELAIDGPIDLSEISSVFHLINLRKLLFNSLGLNLLILFPVNAEEAEDNGDQISVRHFVDLVLHLVALESLCFKDCSQDALDWPRVNAWCQALAAQVPTVSYRDHFYDIHGQRIQHGLTLRLPPNFNRGDLTVPDSLNGDARSNGRGFFGGVLRIFGIQQ